MVKIRILQIQGAIQCLRRQEEVGRWSKKYSFLSTIRVKVVYVEVGRRSKKDQILSTYTLNGPLVEKSLKKDFSNLLVSTF